MFYRHGALACLVALAGLGLAGCTTPKESSPPRTATEELLISRATDHAAEQLKLGLPPGTKVFVDTSYFEGTDSKYAIGEIRDQLLKQGADLVADKKDAQAVAEIRAGALSIDEDTTLYGIPGFTIPIPLTSGGLPFPELALYKKDQRRGVAKFALTTYDAKQGSFASSSGPVYGYSNRTHFVVLLFFSWTRNDMVPKGQRFNDQIKQQDKGDKYQPISDQRGLPPEAPATAPSGAAPGAPQPTTRK